MSRHSKNRCSAPVFSYHERQRLMGKEFGTKHQRLGKDSIKAFDACTLCLQSVKTPMADPKGHIFCKECVYEYLLTQKKEIKKQIKLWEEKQKLLQAAEEAKQAQEREAIAIQFHKSETTVLATTGNGNGSDASKKLNAFWMPSLTPTAKPTIDDKPSSDPKCPNGHKLKLKQLISVNFTAIKGVQLADPTVEEKYQCPTCMKSLNRVAGITLLKPCGHVVCKSCSDKFIKKEKGDTSPKQCCQCHLTLPNDSDIIPLQAGGSSFAGHSSGEEKVASVVTPSPWI